MGAHVLTLCLLPLLWCHPRGCRVCTWQLIGGTYGPRQQITCNQLPAAAALVWWLTQLFFVHIRAFQAYGLTEYLDSPCACNDFFHVFEPEISQK